jgi:hypothetical protein
MKKIQELTTAETKLVVGGIATAAKASAAPVAKLEVAARAVAIKA